MAALTLAVVGLTSTGVSAQNPGPSGHSSWIVSLKKYGYRGPQRGFIDDPGSLANIAFSRGTVAVIFDEKAEEEISTDKKIWYGSRISVFFFDAATGALVAKRSWIGDLDWHRCLIPTADGNFVFLLTKFPEPIEIALGSDIPLSKRARSDIQGPHPATLLLLSSTGDELKRVELPARGGGWQILASPSGKSVLLNDEHDNSFEFRLMDADTLEERALWSAAVPPKLRPSAISDEYLLFAAGKRSLIGKFKGESRNVSLPEGNAEFLSGDSVVTVTPPTLSPVGRATITSITGEEVASIDLDIHDRMEGAMPPVVAANGQRFGTVIDQIVGRFLRRYQSTAYVWQGPQNNVVLKANIPFSERPEAALSADGSALAVLNAGKIAMYRLPAPGSPSR